MPKLPSSTPSSFRSCSLCRIVWKSTGLSWLNTYAQLPMEIFFAMREVSVGVRVNCDIVFVAVRNRRRPAALLPPALHRYEIDAPQEAVPIPPAEACCFRRSSGPGFPERCQPVLQFATLASAPAEP